MEKYFFRLDFSEKEITLPFVIMPTMASTFSYIPNKEKMK